SKQRAQAGRSGRDDRGAHNAGPQELATRRIGRTIGHEVACSKRVRNSAGQIVSQIGVWGELPAKFLGPRRPNGNRLLWYISGGLKLCVSARRTGKCPANGCDESWAVRSCRC